MLYQFYRPTAGNVDILLKEVYPTGSQSTEAMGADVVDMAFELPVYVDFRINDFCLVYGRRYNINLTPTVTKESSRKYIYKIQLEAYWYDLAKVQYQFLNPANALLEPTFTLMGSAATFMDLLVQNANRHTPGWTVGFVDDTDYQNIAFDKQNCLQALHQLAQEFETEFWIDNKTIHLTKREVSSGYTFEYGKGKGLYNIARQNKTNTNILTRLYVRGGSTNLPTGYGSDALLMPNGDYFIEDPAKIALYGLIEKSETFSEIFPKREGTVTGVTAGDDNWMYLFDTDLDFDINAQKAPGLDAKIAFNTGQLAGYTFTINSYNHAAKRITLNKNTDETSLDIPSNLLRPAIGDKYVLIDIIMPESYVTAAEQLLADTAQLHYNENSDPKFLLAYSATTDRLFIKNNAIDVVLGTTAILLDNEIGINTELRIAKYTRDLQDPDLYTNVEWSDTIGANEIIRQYQQQKRTLQLLESSGLLDINQLRKNIFLNRLSESEGYLYLAGQKVKAGLADLATTALHANLADYALDSDKWDGQDFADYLDQPVRTTDDVRFKSISSTSFVSGALGSGFKIDEVGNATFDSLTVRKEFNVYELVLNKISGTNGALAVTDTIKIDTVTETIDGYDCTIDTGESTVAVPFQVNDLIRCQVWNGTSVKYYFAQITAVGSGTFTIAKAGKVGAGIPAPGDTVVRFGNTTNADRQGLLYLTASDSGAPYLDVLNGVTSDNLAGKTKVRLGKLDGIVDADLGALSGYGLYGQNVYVKGKVHVTGGNAQTIAGSQVLANIAEANAISSAYADAQAKADAAQAAAAVLSQQLVDGVTVGGRNFISDSRYDNYEHNNGVTSANIVSDKFGDCVEFERLSGNGGYQIINAVNIAAGSEVTFSVKAKDIDSAGWHIGFSAGANRYSSIGSNNFDSVTDLGDGWFLYTRKTTLDSNNLTGIFGLNSIGGKFRMCQLKGEIGNKATDWTPAPEDVQSAIDTANALAQTAQNNYTALTTSLKEMAYQDVVELSKLGTTVIEGGKIKTTLLDADYIRANVVNAGYINTLELDAAIIKSGTIDSARINASQILVNAGGATTAQVATAKTEAINTAQATAAGYTDSKSLATLSSAQSYADGKASVAQANAISQASTDAQNKANAAQANAAVLSQQLVDGVTVGGRNCYKNSSTPITPYFGASIDYRNSDETINGFRVTGVAGGDKVLVRLNYVITGNGYWTISFWAKTNGANVPISLTFCNNTAHTTGVDPEWRYFSFTTNVQNWDATIYNFIDIYDIQYIYLFIKDLKVEKGNKATDWTPAPEDVQAAIDTANALAQTAQNSYNTLTAELKAMAWEDVVELSKLGTTVIQGGKIKTTLLDADYIRANIVNADYINTLEILTNTIKTSLTGKRVEISGTENNITIFDSSNSSIVEVDDDKAFETQRTYYDPYEVSRTYGPGIRVGNSLTRYTGMGRYGFTVINQYGSLRHSLGVNHGNQYLPDINFDAAHGFYLRRLTKKGDTTIESYGFLKYIVDGSGNKVLVIDDDRPWNFGIEEGFKNTTQIASATFSPCGSGEVGTTHTKTSPAGTFIRPTQSDANTAAYNDALQRAQLEAESSGSCLLVAYHVKISITDSYHKISFQVKDEFGELTTLPTSVSINYTLEVDDDVIIDSLTIPSGQQAGVLLTQSAMIISFGINSHSPTSYIGVPIIIE